RVVMIRSSRAELADARPRPRSADFPAVGLHAREQRVEHAGAIVALIGAMTGATAQLVRAFAAEEDFDLAGMGAHGRGPPWRSGASSSPFAYESHSSPSA